MSYSAIVTRIQTRPHPNADRLQLGLALGSTVVVGLDTADNELGIYFPVDGQLSEEFCAAHDLVQRVGEDGKRAGGYFGKTRRVRAQSFRGVKSDGFWCPLSYLDFAGGDTSTLSEGDAIDEFGGVKICQKYLTPATIRASKNGQGKGKSRRGETLFFRKHPDTPQLRHVLQQIPFGSRIYATEKLHGTSGRHGYVTDEVEMPWWKRFLNRLRVASFSPRYEFKYLSGSRNVILDDDKPGFYGTNEFRRNAVRKFEMLLHPGETVYFEIVGWVGGSTPIMQPASYDKKLEDDFGHPLHLNHDCPMSYDYGVPMGECDIYVYRITRADVDGNQTELPWSQLVGRCKELGIKPVPLLSVQDFVIWGNGDPHEAIEQFANGFAKGHSLLNPRQIREGVVLRIEEPDGRIWFAKHKSWLFKYLEGIVKDSDVVDLEEAS